MGEGTGARQPQEQKDPGCPPCSLLLTRAPIVSKAVSVLSCPLVGGPWCCREEPGTSPPTVLGQQLHLCVCVWVWGAGTEPKHHWENSQVPLLCPGVAKQDHWVDCEEDPTSPGGRWYRSWGHRPVAVWFSVFSKSVEMKQCFTFLFLNIYF